MTEEKSTGEKVEGFGKSLQTIGCFLTLVITIPILIASCIGCK